MSGRATCLISAVCTILLNSFNSLLGMGRSILCACMHAYGGLSASSGSQPSEHESGGPRVRGASNLSKCKCAKARVSASEDQARLTGEGVKQPGSKGVSGSLKASSGCEGACVSLKARAQRGASVNPRLNSKSTTWNGFRRPCWLLGSWKKC